ncbi:hypothetical protein P261_01422 [Lachnospiraceae bacterium TWA4]|nr:hypothetical protein P261_01422 [Lachnospiraceae bacterium TWA4]
MLRDKYIRCSSGRDYTFKSVILAGVYDIRTLKLKIRPEEEHRYNSPWNVAVDYTVDMSLSKVGIEKMLKEYKIDHVLDFDERWFAKQIYDYTSGYPFLVSRICELLDKKFIWTKEGLQDTIRNLLVEDNTLFEDLAKKLDENIQLRKLIYAIVVEGKNISFNRQDELIALGVAFGWLKGENGRTIISNRIFETVIYNKLLQERTHTDIYEMANVEQYQLKSSTELFMDKILERFASHYKTIYAGRTANFLENEARIILLSFLKPIINGTGNYYIEATSMDGTRTDIVVDYHGHQYIIELKIWHGNLYEKSGKEQLVGYLKNYELPKGWLLSFCFNKNKETLVGSYEEEIDGKVIREFVV